MKPALIAALAIVAVFVAGMRLVHWYDLRCQRRDRAAYDLGAHGHAPHVWNAVTTANQDARRHWWGRVVVPSEWDEAQIIGHADMRPAYTTATGRVIW